MPNNFFLHTEKILMLPIVVISREIHHITEKVTIRSPFGTWNWRITPMDPILELRLLEMCWMETLAASRAKPCCGTTMTATFQQW